MKIRNYLIILAIILFATEISCSKSDDSQSNRLRNIVGSSQKWIEEQRKNAGTPAKQDSKNWRMGGGVTTQNESGTTDTQKTQ